MTLKIVDNWIYINGVRYDASVLSNIRTVPSLPANAVTCTFYPNRGLIASDGKSQWLKQVTWSAAQVLIDDINLQDDYQSYIDSLNVIPVTSELVKMEARRRIAQSDIPWMVEREATGGQAIPQDLKDWAAVIRNESAVLEIALPLDYIDDIHWTASP